jgi:hypothetical protein
MNDSRLFRVGASGGIIFVIMQMVAQGMIQVGGMEPSFTASASEVTRFFTSRDPTLVQIGDYVSALSFVAFIWFLGALRSTLRDAEGESGWLADVAFGCGLISSAISVIGGWSLAFFRVGNGLDPETARLIFDLGNFAFASTWVLLAGMLFAVGAVALRTGAMPRWLGWGSLLLGLGLLAGRAAWTSQAAFTPYVLYWVWLISASVMLMRGAVKRREAHQRGRGVAVSTG